MITIDRLLELLNNEDTTDTNPMLIEIIRDLLVKVKDLDREVLILQRECQDLRIQAL